MKTRRQKRALTVGIMLVIVMFAGEFRADVRPVQEVSENNLELSHQTHIEFVKKLGGTKNDCTDCHVLDDVTNTYTLNETFCKRCHIAKTPIPWDTPKKARELKDIVFKHTEHTKIEPSRKKYIGQVKCIECHESTMNDEHEPKEPFVTSRSCISCHAKEKVDLPEKNCSSCHEEKKKNKVEPQNHKKNWNVRHGSEKRWNATNSHGQQCELCHSRASCVSCHRTKRPRNHTGMWRIRMHGTSAKWDRERCKTCHQTGACVSCHRRTPPVTHRGAWSSIHGRAIGPDSSERCATCHQPGWCTDCHAGTQ